MTEDVTLNEKEQRRLVVLNRIIGGQMSATEAGELLGLSARQVRRILAAYRKEGAAALVHGNRGRAPRHRIDPAIRERVRELARLRYAGTNHQHLTELLAEREDLHLSYASIKRILAEDGIKSPRTRRGRRHRRRRERYPQEGLLLQMDGSPHDWLEGRGPRLTLMAAIDDATGMVPAATFREQEDAAGYLLLLQEVVLAHGRPVAVYHDRHGIFGREQRTPSIEQELAGVRSEPTQVERVLQELEITSIAARSPQAKGRVERLFGTLQDRLVTELRLIGITTQEEANAFLPGFLARFNAQFAVPARQEGSAYRPLPEQISPDAVFCFTYRRTVGADNTIRFASHRLQLQPSHGRASFAKCRVLVREHLDGTISVHYQDRTILSQEAPLEAPTLRARGGKRTVTDTEEVVVAETVGMLAGDPREDSPTDPTRQHIHRPPKPAANHPWRRGYKHRHQKVPEGTKSLSA